jgi:hypothetical protein
MLKRLATFLNLLDNEGNLSITNIAVIVCITKMAFAKQMNGCDLGALLAVVANYAHKRVINDAAS